MDNKKAPFFLRYIAPAFVAAISLFLLNIVDLEDVEAFVKLATISAVCGFIIYLMYRPIYNRLISWVHDSIRLSIGSHNAATHIMEASNRSRLEARLKLSAESKSGEFCGALEKVATEASLVHFGYMSSLIVLAIAIGVHIFAPDKMNIWLYAVSAFFLLGTFFLDWDYEGREYELYKKHCTEKA